MARNRPMLFLLLLALLPGLGCRAHPVSLAISLIGDVVDDKDVEERAPLLLGKAPAAADAMFGDRHDTLSDVNADQQWLIYPEPEERFAESFYVVEANDGRIVGLFKCKRNIDGLEDVEHTRLLEDKIFGRSPREIESATDLGRPLMVMRSKVSGEIARIYDARNWTHTRGARYCVLVFDERERCEDVRMIGVTASTGQAPPAG